MNLDKCINTLFDKDNTNGNKEYYHFKDKSVHPNKFLLLKSDYGHSIFKAFTVTLFNDYNDTDDIQYTFEISYRHDTFAGIEMIKGRIIMNNDHKLPDYLSMELYDIGLEICYNNTVDSRTVIYYNKANILRRETIRKILMDDNLINN